MDSTPTGLRVGTANMDWAKRHNKEYVQWLCERYDVLLFQELKDATLMAILPEGWTSLQDASDKGRMGACIAVRDAAVEVLDHGLVLGSKPIISGKRIKMLVRWIAWARLRDRATGRTVPVISAHFPPKRFRALQPGYKKRLRELVDSFYRPIIGTDANGSVKTLAADLGLECVASGIVGLLYKHLTITDTHVRWYGIKHDYTDHPSVAADFILPEKTVVEPPPPPEPPTKITYPAITAARHQSHHGPQFGTGECQLRVHLCYNLPSIGDFDGDGMADAEDAWKQAKHKHAGDRVPPRGNPVFWGGGSHDNGHVAISAGVPGSKLGNLLRRLFGRELETWIWSTDIRRPGFFDFVPLSLIEEKWGLPYLGWTEDYCGRTIQNGAPL